MSTKSAEETSDGPPINDQSLNLEVIMGKFSSPISEEHAWAIVYQALKCLENLIYSSKVTQKSDKVRKKSQEKSGNRKDIKIVGSSREIFLKRDGSVDDSTFLNTVVIESDGSTTSRKIAPSVEKAISEFGMVMYAALDFGLKHDEERELTPGIEQLFDLMASLDPERTVAPQSLVDLDDEVGNADPQNREWEGEDEGIEQDHDDLDSMDHLRSLEPSPTSTCSTSTGTWTRGARSRSSSCSVDEISGLQAILQVKAQCENHLSSGREAEEHYKKVCRALVSEAAELSLFLERTRKQEDLHSKELEQLALKDWAHLWISTMEELRQGVKLKKTNYTKTPFEYALTPYEILMDDIRSRRYKLNKVMVDGEIPPTVKKDAHDIILDFIRSRPPLKPVSNRKLNPIKRKYSTPQELLMTSIRETTIENLRKIEKPTSPKLSLPENWSSSKIFETIKERSNEDSLDDSDSSDTKPKIVVAADHEDEIAPLGTTPKVVVMRKARRPTMRSLSMAERQRPLSMTCLLGAGAEKTSPSFRSSIISEETTGSDGRQRTLIRPDPSFLKGIDPDNDQEDERSPKKFLPPSYDQVAKNPLSHSSSEVNLAVNRRFPNLSPESNPNVSLPGKFHSRHSHRLSMQMIPDEDGFNNLNPETPLTTFSPQQFTQHLELEAKREAEILRSVSTRFSSLSVSDLQNQQQLLSRGVQMCGSSRRMPSRRPCYYPAGMGGSMMGQYGGYQRRSAFGKRRNYEHFKSHGSLNNTKRFTTNIEPFRTSHESQQLMQQQSNGVSSPLMSLNQWHSTPLNTPQHHQSVSRINPIQISGPQSRKGLNLSHEEVSHIRSVLVRAKLEALPLSHELKADLEKSRVCFLCTKVKFGLFNWTYVCKFCRHSVCSGCIEKMKVALDHFKYVPVGFLSPMTRPYQQSSFNQEKHKTQKKSSFWTFGRTAKEQEDEYNNGPEDNSYSLPSPNVFPDERARAKLKRSNTMNSSSNWMGQSPNFQAQQVPSSPTKPTDDGAPTFNVCLDCKGVIENISRHRSQFQASPTRMRPNH